MNGNRQQGGRLVNVLSVAENINQWMGRITLYLVFMLPAVMLYEVVLRYIFNSPTIWAFEVSNFLFGGIIILGGGYLLLHKGHVSVDIIYNRLSVRGRAILDLCTAPLFFLFVGVLLWQGTDMFWTSLSRWENSPSVWGPALWPVKLLIPVGCGLMLIQLLVNFVKNIMIVRYYYKETTIAKKYYY